MHDLISAHLKKGAEHHEKLSEHHASLHSLHKERSEHLEDSEGNPVGGRHHRLMAEQHARLSKVHAIHAAACKECAKAIETRAGGESDAGKVFVGEPDLQKLFSLD